MNDTRTRSLFLSRILTSVAFLILIGVLFLIPPAADWYDSISGLEPVKTPLMITLYVCDAFALPTVIFLYKLLGNIAKQEVFIEKNTFFLRMISWLLMLIGLTLIIFTFVRTLSLFFGFVFSFLGLIIRVLKNVFAEAVAIKAEQDYTI